MAIVTPPLLNERYDPAAGGKWKDCGWASAMMLAYKRGKRDFALGYDYQEREALERSCSRPPETGATIDDIDVATGKRWGFEFEKIADLAAALRGPASTGLLVNGNMHVMPTYEKRWDPAFGALAEASHTVYVQPMGDGQNVRLLDPEATDGFLGDVINLDLIVAFNAGWGPAQVRLAREPAAPTPAPVPSGVVLKYGGYLGYRGTWRVNANGSRFRSTPYINGTNILEEVNAGFVWSNSQTTDKGTIVNGSGRWLGDATGTRWMHVSLVTLVK